MNSFIFFLLHNVYNSKFLLCYIVLELHERHVLTFYMNFVMYAQKQQLQCNPPPPPPNPPHIALCSCLVHVLKNCFTMFQNMRHGRTKYTGGS